MTMTFEAPHPGAVTAMLLPNPDLDNSEGQDLSLDFRLSINGTRSTYVKSNVQKRLNFSWTSLGRGKLVEVEEFYKLYTGGRIKLTDFRGDEWDLIFSDNPITISVNKRSYNSGAARKESGSLELEFLGTQI